MPKQTEKSYVVKTLSVSIGADQKFEAMFDKLVKYAVKNKLKKPTKSELFAQLIEATNIKPEEFFS